MKKPRIYISYVPSDRTWATALARALEAEGATVWIDVEEIALGAPIHEAAEKGLRTSDWIVVLLSRETSPSPNTLFEMGVAVGMGKRIVPVFSEGMDPSRVPWPLRYRRGLIRESPEETARKVFAAAQDAASEKAS